MLIGGAWLAFGFFGVQALFMNTVVNEDIPVFVESIPAATSSAIIAPTATPPATQPDAPIAQVSAMPIAAGEFVQGDSTYTIQGKASVMEKDGESLLVLSDFSVTNGPDLFVYLVSAANTENGTVRAAVKEGSFIEIARLKGNVGNQVYVLPKGTTVKDGSIVSIWCKRFSRNFGSAELESANP